MAHELEKIQDIDGHYAGVFSITWIDENRIVSAGGDCTLKMFNIHTSKCLQTFTGHTDDVNSVCIVSGAKILSCSDDYTAKLWNIKTGRCEQTFSGHIYEMYCAAVSHCAQYIFTGSSDGGIHIWRISTGACVSTFQGHPGNVDCIATPYKMHAHSDQMYTRTYGRTCTCTRTTPQNNIVISGSEDATIKVWDWKKSRCLVILAGHTDVVCSVTTLPDTQLLSCSDDMTIKLYNYATGECLYTFADHTDAIQDISLFGTDCFVSVAINTVKLWSLTKLRCLATLQLHEDLWCVSTWVDKRTQTNWIAVGQTEYSLCLLHYMEQE